MSPKRLNTLGAVGRVTLDFVYVNLSRIPDRGEEITTDTFIPALGGGPPAALITAARLGAQGRLATSLGQDYFSSIAKSLLDGESVNYAGFYRGNENIPVNISSVMTFGSRDRSFISYFSPSPFCDIFEDEIYEYVKGVSFCIASEPFDALFRRLNRDGCRIIYDTGWKDDLSLESLKSTLGEVYLFAPNEKEALKLTGAATAEEALEILSRYLPHPVIKRGKHGALAWKNGRGIAVPAFDFDLADATGAGDAFLGGLSYGLLQGWDILRCVELGNYTGGKAVTAVGCLCARPALEEYERLRAEMTSALKSNPRFGEPVNPADGINPASGANRRVCHE